MARKSKGVVQRAVVTPDTHFPLADMSAISSGMQAIAIGKPDISIALGASKAYPINSVLTKSEAQTLSRSEIFVDA